SQPIPRCAACPHVYSGKAPSRSTEATEHHGHPTDHSHAGSVAGVTGRGEPNWQPISMLATIARLTDEGLKDAREQYATLLRARPKPYVLDDATIARITRVNGESVDCCDVYEQQLQRWQAGRLTVAQRREVARVLDATRELRQVHTRIVELADELGRGTIERQLAKSDIELGLEYMLGHQRF
ncbi:MAG: hypothetical protein LC777_16750, partial [Actinobacteria bacterium]|nr:hypothetical protein [Actinomycetota bacterium]